MLKAINQKVIVEIVTRDNELKDKIESIGLLAPTKILQGEPKEGIVYAISKSIKNPEIKVGDHIRFEKEGMFQGFEYDGKKLVDVEYSEISGRFIDG